MTVGQQTDVSLPFGLSGRPTALFENACVGLRGRFDSAIPGQVAAERLLGAGQFTVRGQAISSVAQPSRFYLLQRVRNIYNGLDKGEKATLDAMLESSGMADVLTILLARRLAQADNLEVWL